MCVIHLLILTFIQKHSRVSKRRNSFVCGGKKTRPHLEHSLQDTSSCNASLQVVDLTAGLVYIKRSDD